MKKIKIFLGGYINSSNAQNLNCLALSNYLDRYKFEIRTMSVYSGNLSIDESLNKEIKIFNCFKPFKFSRKIGYLWGIFNSDVVYLPKNEDVRWNKFLIKLFNKKSFKTVEGIFDEKNLESALSHHKNYDEFINSFKFFDKIFSITLFLKEYNLQHHSIVSDDNILYLGSDIKTFLNEDKKISSLKNVVFIGRLLKRKGVFDLIELANKYKNIQFNLVGEGEDQDKIKKFINENSMKNIKLYGKLNHEKMSLLLKNMDLHIFPSRSEGFPKVTLETAASGVPSIVYNDYGASEWITHKKDGFIVNTLDEISDIIQILLNEPNLLQECSKNSIELAKTFDWKVLVKEWEEEIIKIMRDK